MSDQKIQHNPLDVKPGVVGHETIIVDVKFSGSVEVLVPMTVPKDRRKSLAENVALARILAIAENQDSLEDDACNCYAEAHKLSEQQAGREWDECCTVGVSGTWESGS